MRSQIWLTVVRSFFLHNLFSSRSSCSFACAGTTTTTTTTRRRRSTGTVDTEKYNDRPPRYWPKYGGTRRVRLLDGTWNASYLESQNGIHLNGEYAIDSAINRFDSMDPNIDISKINTHEKVTVPSTIEVIVDPKHGYLPGYMGYRGVSFFRTQVETNGVAGRSTPQWTGTRAPGGPAARIQFQACSFYCRIWLNGVEIGDHIGGGYVAWWLDVSDEVLDLGHVSTKLSSSLEEKRRNVLIHELFVLVDNRFNSTTAPLHTGGDFWHYGGILRSVEWHDRPSLQMPTEKLVQSSKDDNNSTNFGERHIQGHYNVDSNIATETKYHKWVLNRDMNQQEESSLSNIWPWRLYIVPRKDMKSVELSLQLVGENDNLARNRTNTDLVSELKKQSDVKIYFDGDVTKNALENDVLANETVHLDSDSYSTQKRNYSGKGNDLLVTLGIFPVPSPRIWSTSDPQLHTVSIDINGAIVTERFGLRFWDVGMISNHSMVLPSKIPTNSNTSDKMKSNKIRLNGKILKLMGWNHHTQWPYTAASPTDEQLDEDIRLLKESGHANFVRGAHYPQDPRWLDRLDEHGIVVWCGELLIVVKMKSLSCYPKS